MTKNISKVQFYTNKDGFSSYEKIIDIYNEGGCEKVREYIENNDIDSIEYNEALDAMLRDDNTDELFELMITHKKFKHTEVVDSFIYNCNSKFKLDLVWKVKELDFYKIEMKLKQYYEEIKPELSESELAQLELGQLKLCRSKLSERGKEIESKIYLTENKFISYINLILSFGHTNALIKILEYKPTLFKSVDFSNLFRYFKKGNYDTGKYDILNYILNNENTKKVVAENFINFVDAFTKKETLSLNMEEEDFKKVLDVISKSVSEDQFQFLLEYLMRELVYTYRCMERLYNIFKVEKIDRKNHYNVIELVKYIHNLYGNKFKISFNIDYEGNYHNQIREKHRYNDLIYDQMIFNGYEFLSTFASLFYEDLFFPKTDLVSHINCKNDYYKSKIEEDNLDKEDIIFFIEYQKTLSKLFSNIHTITKEIDSVELKYLKYPIEEINIIYDKLVRKCPENLRKFL